MRSFLTAAVSALFVVAIAGATNHAILRDAQLEVSIEPTWVVDEFVEAIRIDAAGRLLAVGATSAGPAAAGAVVDAQSGALRLALDVHGSVNAIVADGRGGWFVGGRFDRVRGLRRRSLVHIGANGRIDRSWQAGVGGRVNALVLHEGVLYAGGGFRNANGRPHGHLAAFDVFSGRLTAWRARASGEVFALAAAGDRILVGGKFKRVNDVSRPLLAAVGRDDGRLLPWRPELRVEAGNSEGVRAIAVSRRTVYVGGHFDHVGGEEHRNLAAIDLTSGRVAAANLDADRMVLALAANGRVVVAGGRFERVAGERRQKLAFFDAQRLTLLPGSSRQPDIGAVHAIALDAELAYVGGVISPAPAAARRGAFAVRLSSGALGPWNPGMNNEVNALAVAGGRVAAGGMFTSTRGVTLPGLAAIGSDGRPLAWSTDARRLTAPIATSTTTVFANNDSAVVAVDRRSGVVAPLCGQLRATRFSQLFASRGWLIGAEDYERVVALELSSCRRLSYVPNQFDPQPVAVDRELVYVAISDTLVALERRTLEPRWSISTDGAVATARRRGSTLFVGGAFASIDGEARPGLAAIDVRTGRVTNWRAVELVSPEARIQAIAIRGDALFVGGWNIRPDTALIAVSAVTGKAIGGVPRIVGFVNDIRVHGDHIWLTGTLTRAGSKTVGGIVHLRVR